jgi:hypothetical protein
VSALPPNADIGTQSRNVRFVPERTSVTRRETYAQIEVFQGFPGEVEEALLNRDDSRARINLQPTKSEIKNHQVTNQADAQLSEASLI